MGSICKLCGKEAKIRNSHIIPEFFYKTLYDPPHRFFELSTNKLDRIRYPQKGIRDRLLCDKCELVFSKYESYGCKLFSPDNIKKLKSNSSIDDVDYTKFKLFQLSILWRFSVSRNKTFKNIDLGEHEKIIRLMLINGNPGLPHEYGCILSLLLFENRVFDSLIIPPEEIFYKNKLYIRSVFGGFIWFFYINNDKDGRLESVSISDSGKLRIEIKDAKKMRFLHKHANDLAAANKLSDQ